MDDEKVLMVPYIVHEGAMAREERTIKRLFIALAVSIICILASNLAWLYIWNQYDYVSEESVVDLHTSGSGNTNYIGEDGEIYNGITDSGD